MAFRSALHLTTLGLSLLAMCLCPVRAYAQGAISEVYDQTRYQKELPLTNKLKLKLGAGGSSAAPNARHAKQGTPTHATPSAGGEGASGLEIELEGGAGAAGDQRGDPKSGQPSNGQKQGQQGSGSSAQMNVNGQGDAQGQGQANEDASNRAPSAQGATAADRAASSKSNAQHNAKGKSAAPQGQQGQQAGAGAEQGQGDTSASSGGNGSQEGQSQGTEGEGAGQGGQGAGDSQGAGEGGAGEDGSDKDGVGAGGEQGGGAQAAQGTSTPPVKEKKPAAEEDKPKEREKPKAQDKEKPNADLLAQIMRALLIAVAIIFGVLIILALWRRWRDREQEETPPEPEPQPIELLESLREKTGEMSPQSLAAEQRYEDAIHAMLLELITYVISTDTSLVQPSLTSRELLTQASHNAALRAQSVEALGVLVNNVELCIFGRRPATQAMYETCLNAFRSWQEQGART